MTKLYAAVLMAAVAVGSMAMAMTTRPELADEQRVTAQIDTRLHQLLVEARLKQSR